MTIANRVQQMVSIYQLSSVEANVRISEPPLQYATLGSSMSIPAKADGTVE